MVIDLILNRKDGAKYNPKQFYNEVVQYGWIGWHIATALDGGTEQDVQKAIAEYVLDNEYNPNIIEYANSVDWI